MNCESDDKENTNNLTQDCGYEYCEEDTDTILIDLIKNFPHLYDKSTTDFKNAKKKEHTWMEISAILQMPVLDCKSRWQRLREKFSREKKRQEKENRSGSATCTRSTFLLYNNMKFLDSFVKSTKTYTNIIPRGTHFTSNILKNTSILEKSKASKTINNISNNSSQVLTPSSPSSKNSNKEGDRSVPLRF